MFNIQNMNTFKIFIVVTMLLCIFSCNNDETRHKQPTEVKIDMEDGELKNLKQEYFEKLHQAAPNVDWKKIESDRALNQHFAKAEMRKKQIANRNDIEPVAEGNLLGTWIERGSDNQSGSVFTVQYDRLTDELYLISAGGSLFKSPRDGSNWSVVQQDIRLNGRYFFMFDTPDDGQRMVAESGGQPIYSDDGGISWQMASGFNGKEGYRIKDPYQIDNETQTIYFLFRKDWWSDVELLRSLDLGKTYESIHSFATSNINNVAISKSHHSNDLFIIEQFASDMGQLYSWNHQMAILDTINMEVPFAFGETGKANLVSSYQDSVHILYSYNEENMMYKSVNNGLTWETTGEIPISPWDVRVFLSASNPNILFTGGVNAYRSANGGQTWDLINEWHEYYNNVETALHADIMSYGQFETQDGTEFITISNHGGLSITYDNGVQNNNIGLKGLNVSQYYDVSSQPGFEDYVYAGAQDQGFQRGFVDSQSDNEASLDQVISGDYGHTVFTSGGGHLWTVYPGGWVSYYPNPTTGGLTDSYDLESDQESVWIPPLMAHPDPSKDIVYLAGGSAEGGNGKYIIKLEKTNSEIVASNLPYNFNTEGDISAMATNAFDSDIWYVAKSNGTIYKSTDGGLSFTLKYFNGPGANYLYGSDIMPSKIDPNVVYLGGSGYSNAAVFKSTDGGETYSSMNFGLPQTTVFELATNADESMIFAATEAGPFVYIQAEQQWFDMSGLSAPNQTYWSVEYLEQSNIVRFGTYGRGIWDFRIDEMVANHNMADRPIVLKAYPNPSRDFVHIENPENNSIEYTITNSTGAIVKKGILQTGKNVLDIQNFNAGYYIINAQTTNKNYTTKIIKI